MVQRLLLVTVLALTLVPRPVAAQSQYRLQVLGPFDGRQTFATAISDRTEVVGYTFDRDGYAVPLHWTPTAGYQRFLGDVNGAAYDINNASQIIGTYLPEGLFTMPHGFLWSAQEGLVDLGTDFLPARINEDGVIAGTCGVANPPFAVCVWNHGTTVLDVPDGHTALSINAAGDVAGYAVPPGPTEREAPFIWRHDSGARLLPVPTQGLFGLATGVNDRGTVVGWSYMPTAAGSHVPLMWDAANAPVSGMPAVDGIFTAISNSGLVVGQSPALDNLTAHGFTWRVGGPLVMLTGGTGNQPTDINEAGVVAGVIYNGTQSYAAIWRPAPLTVTTPNVAARWGTGTGQRIAWSYSGQASQFEIDISRDQGRTWEPLTTVADAPGTSQSFYWTVSGINTGGARFRVTAVGDPGASDVNDANIRIERARIQISAPSSTTALTVGQRATIAFRHDLGARAPLAIDVSGDGGRTWQLLAQSETKGTDTSTFSWVVHEDPTTDARLRVRALDGSGAVGVSDVFAIR